MWHEKTRELFIKPDSTQKQQREKSETREKLKIELSAMTESSPEHPNRNEDYAFIDKENAIAGVFDGMGGLKGGQIASETAAGAMFEKLKNAPNGMSEKNWEKYITASLKEASSEILNISQGEKMGTTATVVKILENKKGEKKAVIGNVGDSRAYLMRYGELIRLTEDDSIVQRMIKSGMIKNEDLDQTFYMDLGRGHKQYTVADIRNLICQSLGVDAKQNEKLQPKTRTVDLLKGDMLMLSSDGIHDNLSDEEIKKILLGNEKLMPFEKQLVAKAHQIEEDESNPRSKPDDKTAVVIKISDK